MDSIFDFVTKETMQQGPKLDLLSNMDSYVSKFFKSEKLQQLIEYTLVFLGGAPSNTPALFSLMSHLDYNQGVLYPKGGFYKVVEVMYQLALDQGVKFYFNQPVTEIETVANQVHLVRTAKKKYLADVVIGNADYAHVESLLDNRDLCTYSDHYWNKKVPAPSAFVMYLGIKGKIKKFQHHTLYFGKDWTEHFESIFNAPSWPQQPSLYINVPSVTDPTVAPKGHENLMILVPIAPGLKEDAAWKEHYGNFILDYIEQNMGVALKDNIVVKHLFSVSDFASRYNSLKGNALGGLAHTLFQSALWRPTNKSKKVKNLFFVGANTVPGIGVPPAIISGHLVRDRVRAMV
jgi:phytoene desaturase